MKLLHALTLAAALGACAQPRIDPRDEIWNRHMDALEAQRQAGKITDVQAASSARDKSRELFNDPYMDEVWAYRVMLAGQLERGEIKPDQAAYLDQKKVNEVAERMEAKLGRERAQREQQRALNRPPPPTTITCTRDALGTVCR